MKNSRLCSAFGALAFLVLVSGAGAASVDDARKLEKEKRFGEAAAVYRELSKKEPGNARLRLELADMLAKDRQWAAAAEEYRAILARQPQNTEATRGLAQVNRWRGHVDDAIAGYQKALAIDPRSVDATLGLAESYRLNHDYDKARETLDRAQKSWPKDKAVQQARYDFQRERKLRLKLFFENDLSFTNTELGAYQPFGAREEAGAEIQTEARPGIYTRTDQKLLFTHFLGHKHALDFRYRGAAFSYDTPPAVFSAIDTFQEYCVRYTYAFRKDQVVRVRYTLRPTALIGGQSFSSHKVEAEIESPWNGRTKTTVGSGWLRDLDANAADAASAVIESDNVLIKLGVDYYVDSKLQVAGKYITNPDLDNSINATTLLEASYELKGPYSSLYRLRVDDYKTGNDQTAIYAGLRYIPDRHLWSEGGLKYVTRGVSSGIYFLASLVYKF